MLLILYRCKPLFTLWIVLVSFVLFFYSFCWVLFALESFLSASSCRSLLPITLLSFLFKFWILNFDVQPWSDLFFYWDWNADLLCFSILGPLESGTSVSDTTGVKEADSYFYYCFSVFSLDFSLFFGLSYSSSGLNSFVSLVFTFSSSLRRTRFLVKSTCELFVVGRDWLKSSMCPF